MVPLDKSHLKPAKFCTPLSSFGKYFNQTFLGLLSTKAAFLQHLTGDKKK
jgi:hypothetical protein